MANASLNRHWDRRQNLFHSLECPRAEATYGKKLLDYSRM